MPDSGFVLAPTARLVDTSIAAVSGGKLKFYAAGTTTPLAVYSDSTLSTSLGSTVYTDSAGHPVASSGSSTKVVIYTGSALVKLVVTDSADTTLATYDNLRCSQDTSSFSTSSSGGGDTVGVKSKTDNYSVVLADAGYWLDCDPGGAPFTITLPSAVTVGDGFTIGIRHAGGTSTNGVKILTVSSQTISRNTITTTSDVLTGGGESVSLVSNGVGWRVTMHTPPRLSFTQPIPVADRLAIPPTSPTAGAFYILTGTPTGDWATFAAGELVRANGQGGWIRYVPTADCGWLAFVQDENMLVQYRDSAWVDLSNIAAPASTNRKTAIFQYQQANGTNGGAVTSGSRQTYPINTFVNSSATNVITGATLTTNTIDGLPVGSYHVRGWAVFVGTDHTQLWFRNSTTSTDLVAGVPVEISSATSLRGLVMIEGDFTVATATDDHILQYRSVNNFGVTAMGTPTSYTDGVEIYGSLVIEELVTSQGATGPTGPQGSIAATPYGALALTNGVNSNIVIGTNQMMRITLTAADGSFDITGFVAPAAASAIFIYNPTTDTMRIMNDATSTAANRILTMTGADVSLTGPSMATFIYDTVDARWILTATQG